MSVQTILATAIVLGVLIFVHELGHFMAAKWVDIEVQRFSIGFGPKIFGFRRGETEYQLSAVPLGGYVKMGGMDDEVMERVEGGGPAEGEGSDADAEAAPPRRMPSLRDFDAKPLWARAFVISAGVIMNVLLAFALYTAVVGFWGVPGIASTRVGSVDTRSLPAGSEALAQLPVSGKVVRVGDRAVGSWDELTEALADAPTGPVQIVTEEPSATVTVSVPATADDRAKMVGALRAWLEPKLGGLNPGQAGDRGGLKADDRIVSVDGVPMTSWDEFVNEIQSHPGREMALVVDRGGSNLELKVTPSAEPAPDPVTGAERTIGRIGAYPAVDDLAYRKVGLVAAVQYGARETIGTATVILDFLWKFVSGGIPANSVGSIVTIGEASGQAARAGIESFLQFIALFSINLAVLNILPIPVLDGGHLLFLAIEGIRRRPVSQLRRQQWSNVGLMILMGVMLFALYNDLARKFREFFPGMF